MYVTFTDCVTNLFIYQFTNSLQEEKERSF